MTLQNIVVTTNQSKNSMDCLVIYVCIRKTICTHSEPQIEVQIHSKECLGNLELNSRPAKFHPRVFEMQPSSFHSWPLCDSGT